MKPRATGEKWEEEEEEGGGGERKLLPGHPSPSVEVVEV
jgi:hypothetical protein